MVGSHQAQWGGIHPGCIIFLLDQSGSMNRPFVAGQPNSGDKKCDMVAAVLNGFLQELILTNTVVRPDGTTDIRPRADIAVIGYQNETVNTALSGSLAYAPFVTLPELQADPMQKKSSVVREISPLTGLEVSKTIEVPIWVRPKADGGTPMCGAFHAAKELASQWVANHPNNYPPVVINVTDGQSTDGDPSQLAHELCQISTSDGQALLFNVHITEERAMPVYYPASDTELPGGDDEFSKYARMLFKISSEIPDTSRNLLAAAGNHLLPGAKGMIWNGDATSVRQMFIFSTIAATTALDPNM